MPPLRRVISCSPSARARTVTAHSLRAIGIFGRPEYEGSCENRATLSVPSLRTVARGVAPLKDTKSERESQIPCKSRVFLDVGRQWRRMSAARQGREMGFSLRIQPVIRRSQATAGETLRRLDQGGIIVPPVAATHRCGKQVTGMRGGRERDARRL